MTDTQAATDRHNQLILGLIIGIPIAIVLLSTLLYWLADNRVVEMGTVNQGELITPPLQIGQIKLFDAFGNPLDYAEQEPLWTFLVVGDDGCNEACQQMLYLTRQTHTGSGKLRNDIRHAYLDLSNGPIVSGSNANFTANDTDSEDLQQWRASRADWQALFADSDTAALDQQGFFLVDRYGWVMMHYHADALDTLSLSELSKGVIKDMKRLQQ